MTFQDFIQQLQAQLKEPLPGEEAHKKMAPLTRLQSSIQPNERTRKSAVLILFYPHQDQIFLPLILRPQYDGVHAGQMAFPGGRAERSDKSLINTALREAQEEIGIKLSDVKILGTLTEIFIPPSNFFALPVVGYLPYKPDFYPDTREVDSVFEVNLNTIIDPNIIKTASIAIKDFSFDVPCYQIESRSVWGATAVMISELLDVIAYFKS